MHRYIFIIYTDYFYNRISIYDTVLFIYALLVNSNLMTSGYVHYQIMYSLIYLKHVSFIIKELNLSTEDFYTINGEISS